MSVSMTQKVVAIAIFLLLFTSCSAPTPPSAPPDYSADPPIVESGFYVQNTETATVNLPREVFLNWLRTADLSEILSPTEGMPAVERTTILEGDQWGDVGDRRRIELADGHYAVETILSSTPERFSYQVWGFTNQAGRFASYATGEFIYQDQGDKTFVTWTYRFKPNSLVARIPLSIFVRNDFQPFMENGLNNMKSASEAASRE